MKKSNKKGYVLCGLLTIIISFLVGYTFIKQEKYDIPETVYQIYLDGEKLGMIRDADQLYSMINEEQSSIKENYGVDQVYPPNGFVIEEYTTYDSDTVPVNKIYDSIKDEKEFTIKGYTVTIKSDDEDEAPKYIYVLDKEIFENAITKFIETFVGETEYQNYINGTQPEIVDVGQTIQNMYFDDNITIKESYISVNETIYTNTNDLIQYLLYGDNEDENKYIVNKGDTVESIAYNNKLNTEEFLIANPELGDENSLLAIGQEVTLSLIDPVVKLVYEMEVVEDTEVQFDTETKYDYSKSSSYKVVEQEGINGITRNTVQKQIVNGEENQGAYISATTTIRETQNQIVTVGKKASSYISGTYIDTGQSWAWPTNSPYIITSPYAYRWGKLHDGIDISGTGKGSPIYAVLDGEVISAQIGGMMGSDAGKNVVIRHNNGYYTVYAHLNTINVTVGQQVSRRQQIGTMGQTGFATGVHLHLGVFIGVPYNGGRSINPKLLWGMK